MTTETASMPQSSIVEKLFAVIVLFLSTGAIFPLLRLEAGGDLADPEGDPVMQAAWGIIYLITLLLILPRLGDALRIIRREKYTFLLTALVLLSVIWSDEPAITLRRSIALAGTTLFGVYLAMRFAPREQLLLITMVLGLCGVLSLVTVLGAPSYGISSDVSAGAWRGIFVHKNNLGRIMSLSSVCFLLWYRRDAPFRFAAVGGLLLSVLLVLLAMSMTSALVVAALIMLILYCRFMTRDSALKLTISAFTIISLAAVSYFLYDRIDDFFALIDRDLSLTGRTELWELVGAMIMLRPWLGYGFNAFWSSLGNVDYISDVSGWSVPHAHNGFLDLALGEGGIGMLLFSAGFAAASWRVLSRLQDDPFGEWSWQGYFLPFMFLINLTESAILSQNSIYWVLYVTCVLSINREPTTVVPFGEAHAVPL